MQSWFPDGSRRPPAGSPNYIVGTQDDEGPYGAPFDAINVFKFFVSWGSTPTAAFTGPTVVPVAEFDSDYPCVPPGSRNCIPQPGTSQRIDILSYRQRPTWRLAYRNFGTYESLVTSQSVEARPGVAGMRWYELRRPGDQPVVWQQGPTRPTTASTAGWAASPRTSAATWRWATACPTGPTCSPGSATPAGQGAGRPKQAGPLRSG